MPAPPEATARDFGAALRLARKAAGLKQRELAPQLSLSARTLMRWERGQAMPRVDVRDAIVGWLRARSGPEFDRALEALGVRFVRMSPATAPRAPLSPEVAEKAKVAVEHALYRAAEEGDIPPRAARHVAIAVLAAAQAAGVTAEEACGLLAPPTAPAR